MVNYSEMRRKFRPKDPTHDARREKTRLAIKRISKEYELKKAALQGGAPTLRRGPLYYAIVIGVMVLLLGSFIGVMTGHVPLGKKRISKADIQVRQSVDALATALGRYRFHTGRYPTDAEGLAALASVTPQIKGWFGPYVRKIVPDPWGEDYQYWNRAEGGDPVLLSKGPDRRLGTTDDVLADPRLFAEPFRDTTWTNRWVPYNLRGIVVAPDERTRRAIEAEVRKY